MLGIGISAGVVVAQDGDLAAAEDGLEGELEE